MSYSFCHYWLQDPLDWQLKHATILLPPNKIIQYYCMEENTFQSYAEPCYCFRTKYYIIYSIIILYIIK